MVLNDEQAKTIKEQIFKQVETFPEDKRAQIKEYVSGMNNEQLEEFLIKNKMIKSEGESGEEGVSEKGECIMCMISGKKIESRIIYEDNDYLSALEINPMTKGHAILIPKEHVKEAKNLKPGAFTIANKIGKHIAKKLGAENFQVNTSDEIGHALINIIPKYKGETIDFKRKPSKKEELKEIYDKIGKIQKKEKTIKIKTEKVEKKNEEKPKINILKMPRRIP